MVLGVLWLPYTVLELFRVGEMEVTLGMMLEPFIEPMLNPMVGMLKTQLELIFFRHQSAVCRLSYLD